MIPALGNLKRLRIAFPHDAVDQPLFPIDPAGPPLGHVSTQRLGLTRALERMTSTFFDQAVEFVAKFRVDILPVEIVIPRRRPKCDFHG